MSQEKELDMVDRDPNGLNAHVKVYTCSIGLFSIWCFLAFSGFPVYVGFTFSQPQWLYICSSTANCELEIECACV